MNFRKIYNECNPILSFEEIYYICNVKPLLEQFLREAHLQEMADTVPIKFARALRNAYLKLKTTSFINIVKEAIKYIKGITIDKNNPKTRLHLLNSNGEEVIIKGNDYNDAFKNANAYADTVIIAYENKRQLYRDVEICSRRRTGGGF